MVSLPQGHYLLIREADKLTLGQNLNLQGLQVDVILMNGRGLHWLTKARMIQYQALLCENPRVKMEIV